jgi:four helix bundle protein
VGRMFESCRARQIFRKKNFIYFLSLFSSAKNWRIALENSTRSFLAMAFPFESLDVYVRALDFVESIETLSSNLKGKVSYSLIDQLCRAALSIPLNIAEGNGRWHKGEKRQFFWIARGSTFECVPIIQILYRKSLLTEPQYSGFYAQLDIIAKMLTNLVKSVEDFAR